MAIPCLQGHLNSRGALGNLICLSLVAVLCSLFYFIGIWHNNGGGGGATDFIAAGSVGVACSPSDKSAVAVAVARAKISSLDFAAHHSAAAELSTQPAEVGMVVRVPPCGAALSEYTPCEDAKRSLRFPRERLMYRERHCPTPAEAADMRCRVPAPHGYRVPVPWPECRDSVWFANVPHKELTVEKAGQNWVRFEGARFRFPGGGTMFPRGADAYIDEIGKLINLRDGSIRTAIDTGCGVASWGAYLLSWNIVTVSFAPKDTHEAQVQFALERGVPALIGILSSYRLPYPSRAFDMAHCSRCLIPWGQYDGLYLIEVDRVLRPGGYWILSGPPINWQRHWKGWKRTKQDLEGEQNLIEDVAKSLCWKKVVQRGDVAIWQKPTNHVHCKITRKVFKNLPFCQGQEGDSAWYTKMENCLTPLPEVSDIKEFSGRQLAKWPERLNSIPPRISSGTLSGITEEMFKVNSELWKRRLTHYKKLDHQLAQKGRYRNMLDMNSYFGGFAAALVDDPVWVMNVIPVEAAVNTLGLIYERGLIGTYQNWCEAMSTYPRTYDFIHADGVFNLYRDRCEPLDILLEMDRILRPKGSAIFRDDIDVLVKIKNVLSGMQWESRIVDHEDGPLEREKILVAVKQYWTAPASQEGL